MSAENDNKPLEDAKAPEVQADEPKIEEAKVEEAKVQEVCAAAAFVVAGAVGGSGKTRIM